jgi:hypothetical protein
MARHLLNKHKKHATIHDIKCLPKRSKERLYRLEILINDGNYKHNLDVLKNKKGMLVVARRSSKKCLNPKNFLPCQYCKLFVNKRLLWHHVNHCSVRLYDIQKSIDDKELYVGKDRQYFENQMRVSSSNCIRESRKMLASSMLGRNSEDLILDEMLSRMNNDDIKDVVRDDNIISKLVILDYQGLGEKEFQKHNDVYRVNQKARTLARLVIKAREISCAESVINLDYLLRPENFDLVVQSATQLSLQENKESLTLGRRIGHHIAHALMIKSGLAIRRDKDDKTKEREAKRFKILFDLEWNKRVNSVLMKRKNFKSISNEAEIPSTQDLVKLRKFLIAKIETLTNTVSVRPTPDNWAYLSKYVCCRLVLFNKRRVSEVTELTLISYKHRPKWHQLHNEEFELSTPPYLIELSKRYQFYYNCF